MISATSQESYVICSREFGQTQAERCFYVLDGRGRYGATSDEVAQLLALPTNHVPARRFSELERDGKIAKKVGLDGDYITRTTRSGHQAVVYVTARYSEPY